MTHSTVYPEFDSVRSIVTDLYIQAQHPRPNWTPDANAIELLRAGLEHALLDSSYLTTYLKHLRKHRDRNLPSTAPLSEEELAKVAQQGLAQLTDARLTEVALDPVALLSLRATLFDGEALPAPWWQRARQLAEQRRPLKTPTEILQELFPAPTEEPSSQRELALADFQDAAEPDSREPASDQPVYGNRSLSADELRWMQGKVEGELHILTTYWPNTDTDAARLEVQLMGLAFLGSSAICTGQLLSAAGTEPTTGRREDQCLVFELPSANLAGLTLELDYREGDNLHFTCQIPLPCHEE